METVANTYNSCILCKSSLVDRNSYLMPCIHSVCEACIKLTEKNGAEKNGSGDGNNSPTVVVNLADEITCKDCKEKFQVAEMVENLLTKKPLSEAAVPPAEEVEVHKCTGCDDSIDATSHCEDCEEWLCDQCVFAHKRVKITKDHTITSKSNNNTKDGTSNETATYCKIHRREKYNFFCETCDMLTCRDCQLMEHKEHKYQFLSEAAAVYKNQTESLLNMLHVRRDTLHQSASKIQEKLAYVKSQKDVVRDEVQSQARKLVEHVIEFAKQILQNLNFVCDAAGKRLAQEGAEASSMLLKIDHMATFLKSLKNESNDLSLLYTKKIILKQANHLAQLNLDLFSLRGQLNLEYRHDTQFLFANLNKLGTVFVNGMRYPPPKNQQGHPQHPQQMHHNSQNGANQHQLDERRKAMALAMQRAAMSQQQHQYNSRMSIGMQQHQNRVPPHQNGQSSLHRNQANLPFNWQTSRGSHGMQSASQNSSQNSNVRLLSQSLMMQQPGRHQQQQQQQQQQFQSMKLNTRPVLNNVAANMSASPQLLSWPGSRSAGASPRSESDNTSKTNSTDDDFLDCIITAAKIKGQKLEDTVGVFTGDESNTINLIDDNEADNAANNALSDLKKMQMELTEPEQASTINVSTAENNVLPRQPTPTPSPQPPPSQQHQQPSHQQQQQSSHQQQQQSSHQQQQSSHQQHQSLDQQHHSLDHQQQPSQQQQSTSPVSEPEKSKEPLVEPEVPPNEEPENDEAPLMRISQEMPICSQPDPNEDYCACCHNGGDVLCCDKCPRVYHLQCHIPPLQCVPPGVFVCLLCEPTEVVTTVEEQDAEMVNGGTKRKAPSGLSDKELKICEKILLELFCHQQSVAFHEPVGRNVLNYHKIVLKPQDFTTIKCKLSRQHFNHYNSVYDFLSDVKQVFNNCALYNDPLSEVGKAGKVVNKFLEDLVEENLPAYLKFVKKEAGASSDKNNSGISSPKRQRLDDETTST